MYAFPFKGIGTNATTPTSLPQKCTQGNLPTHDYFLFL